VDHKNIHVVSCIHAPHQENQTQPISNSPDNLELSSHLTQTSVETALHTPEQPDKSRTVEKAQAVTATRKDKHRLHSMRHAVLSRYPLEALARGGENVRQLRNLERKLRAELKPAGVAGAILFDRLWSSYLRCLLAGRAEALVFDPTDRHAEKPDCTAEIREDLLPTLILNDQAPVNRVFSPDLFRQLALVARYDRHFSREMYRALAVLLVAKKGGQAGLEQCLGRVLGFSIDCAEGSADE
jgi:hypothetical protein